MEFELSFDIDGAAFRDEANGEPGDTADDSIRAECARILREVANSLEAGNDEGRCRDLNGNGVGRWAIREEVR